MKNIDLARIKATLKYENVSELSDGNYLRFDIIPQNADWPKAYLALRRANHEGSYDVLQAGFGEWHSHFDDFEDPDSNIGAALSQLSDIVDGKSYLVVSYDRSGRYLNSTLLSHSAAPTDTHGIPSRRKAASFRRFFFNRPPEIIEERA